MKLHTDNPDNHTSVERPDCRYRSEVVDAIVARRFPRGIRRTEFRATDGATRVDCTDSSPCVREVNPRGHRNGPGGSA